MLNLGTIYTNVAPEESHFLYDDLVEESTEIKYPSFYPSLTSNATNIPITVKIPNILELTDNNTTVDYAINTSNNITELDFYIEVALSGGAKAQKRNSLISNDDITYTNGVIELDLSNLQFTFSLAFYDKLVCVVRLNPGSDDKILADYYDLAKFTIRNDRNKIYVRNNESVVLEG
jgi:hypothetical protein